MAVEVVDASAWAALLFDERETAAVADRLKDDAQDAAMPGPVGCVGHCMSGSTSQPSLPFSRTAWPPAALLYGVGIITDKEDSPHLLLDKIKGELYYAFGETDQAVPAHIPGELKQVLPRARGLRPACR